MIFMILEANAVAMAFVTLTLTIFFEDPFLGSDIMGTIYGLMGFFYFVGIFFQDQYGTSSYSIMKI